MSKLKRPSNSPLTTADWLVYRPYKLFQAYDNYYLKLAGKVFEYFNDPNNHFRGIWDRDALKKLSIVLTCHFEDFANEIGLWRALTEKHQELYGYALPFYDLENYDPEYLNPQDFAYLIWHHLEKTSKKIISPYAESIALAADFCYVFFEEHIDEAPVTDFYEQFLDIDEDIPFFELKKRLKWMALQNYLLGPSYIEDMRDRLEQEVEKDSFNKQWQGDIGKLAYTLEDDYLFAKTASWGAMNTPQWLAALARCDDRLRPAIRRLNQKIFGVFVYEGSDDEYYHYKLVNTNRVFKVRRDSIDLNTKKMKAGSEAGAFSIVNWCGTWWLSGTYSAWNVNATQLERMRYKIANAPFYGWTEEQQQHLRSMADDLEQGFFEYFGDRLVLFENGKDAEIAFQAQQKWWNDKKPLDKQPSKSFDKFMKMLDKDDNKPSPLYDDKGQIAACYIPGGGVITSTAVPLIIELLQANSLSKDEARELFDLVFLECESYLITLLQTRYSFKNLHHPLVPDPDFMDKHLPFFLRYYSPEAFQPVKPFISLVTEE